MELNQQAISSDWFRCRLLLTFAATRHHSYPFTNRLCAHNSNTVQLYIAITCYKAIQSGHNFEHATTAQLSWHVQKSDRIISFERKLQQRWFSQDLNYEIVNRWLSGLAVCKSDWNSVRRDAYTQIYISPMDIAHGNVEYDLFVCNLYLPLEVKYKIYMNNICGHV